MPARAFCGEVAGMPLRKATQLEVVVGAIAKSRLK